MPPSPYAWKGPEVDGITQSIINDWLGCPVSAYIKLILCLEDDLPPQPNLTWGDCFHVGLQHLIQNHSLLDGVERMIEHLGTHYPQAEPSFKHSLPKMLRCYSLEDHMAGDGWQTEMLLDEVKIIDGRPIRFRGKVDGIRGSMLLEHKCKGYTDPILTREEIGQDLQCNVYAYLKNCDEVAYDLIKIPDVQKWGPQQPWGETPEEWVKKIYQGPIGSYGNQYPIYRYKEKWVSQEVLPLPREEQEIYWQQTIIPLVKRICLWYDWVTQPSFSLDNPECYNEIFYKAPVRHFNGRNTEKFKCPYHAYHTGQVGLDDLRPITSHFSELEEE